ncbi:MAG: TerB family tellurite resistance protein [Crocinitomicaceae bacterium]
MKTLIRALAIFFALGILGNMMNHKFSPVVFILDLILFYFGWRITDKEDIKPSKAQTTNDIKNQNKVFDVKAVPSFSEAQKQALISVLYVVAAGDDELHPMEQSYIQRIHNEIKYFGLNENQILNNTEENRILIIEVLMGFSVSQKTYLMNCLDGVLKSDGLELEMEFVYIGSILESIGIDFNLFLKTTNRQNPFNDEAYKRNWKTSFNETQKKAILAILYGIAVDSNLEFSESTSRNFAMNQHMLDLQCDIDDLKKFVNEIDKEVTQIIFGMGEQQKKVFLILACAMGRSRKLNLDKIFEADILMRQCGISSDDFMNEYYQNEE